MLPWIIIAIVIAVIFGVINFKDLYSRLCSFYNKILPVAQKAIIDTKNKAQTKINNVAKKTKKD